MLFKDPHNFGGIKESDKEKVASKWDIALHLPQVTQRKFLFLIADFILKVHRYNKKLQKQRPIGELMQQKEEVPAHSNTENS